MSLFKSSCWLLLILQTLVMGCCVTQRRPDVVAQFQVKHADEAKKYVVLNPIDLTTYRELAGFCMGSCSYGAELKERFGETPGIKEFADRIGKQQSELRASFIKLFKELEESSANGGAICQFEWTDGKTKETGLLAIKSGSVIRREIFLTDYLKNEKQ